MAENTQHKTISKIILYVWWYVVFRKQTDCTENVIGVAQGRPGVTHPTLQ